MEGPMAFFLWALLIPALCVIAAVVLKRFFASLKLHFRTKLTAVPAPPAQTEGSEPFVGSALSEGGARGGCV